MGDMACRGFKGMGKAMQVGGADVEGVGVVGGSSIITMSGCRSNRVDCNVCLIYDKPCI